jgi:hypothetical protein
MPLDIGLDQDLHGSMNDIVLSFSNLAKRAHLWQNREWICSSSLLTHLTRKEQYYSLYMKFDIIKVCCLPFSCSLLNLKKNCLIHPQFSLQAFHSPKIFQYYWGHGCISGNKEKPVRKLNRKQQNSLPTYNRCHLRYHNLK